MEQSDPRFPYHDEMKWMGLKIWTGLLMSQLFVGSGTALSQDSLSFKSIDTHVDSLDLSSGDIEYLVERLTSPFSRDLERVRAVYRFVTTHIEYDRDAYQGGNRRINRSEYDVLSRRKAVCWGYAELFKVLCQASNLTCYSVSGYARDAPTPARAYEHANHVWNAVLVDGQWRLVDATWGATQSHGETTFSIVDSIDYFLADPALLIHSHFPLMKMWQLLPCPLGYEAFLAYDFAPSKQDCTFNFEQQIQDFLRLDFYQQQVLIVKEAYQINPTAANRKYIGHALVDLAVRHKELGDALFESDSIAQAIEEFEAANELFGIAQRNITFYPWQAQNMVYSWANLAQALHRREAEEIRSAERIEYVLTELELLLVSEQQRIAPETNAELRRLIADLRPTD